MRKVITYGTFDILHYGHIKLLERARSLGDYLIVGLSTDVFNETEKKKHAYFNYETREMLLKSIRYVDYIVPEESWEQKEADIRKYNIDVFVIGDDWRGAFDSLSSLCQVIYLPRTPEISTTKIKEDMKRC